MKLVAVVMALAISSAFAQSPELTQAKVICFRVKIDREAPDNSSASYPPGIAAQCVKVTNEFVEITKTNDTPEARTKREAEIMRRHLQNERRQQGR